MTNSDWLRGSPDDELAEFLNGRFGAQAPLIKLWLNQDRRISLPAGYIHQYPINVIYAVFDGNECFKVQFSDDQINGLFAAMQTLTVREHECLRLRFEKFYTLEQIGRVFNVSRERVRQIEGKAIRKLRHPSRSKFFLLGLLECTTAMGQTAEPNQYVCPDRFRIEPIETLEFSVRAENCLKRAGIRTWADVASLADDQIINIRGCGHHTAMEIQNRRDQILISINEEN